MRFVRITWREILIIMKRVEKNEQFGLVINLSYSMIFQCLFNNFTSPINS